MGQLTKKTGTAALEAGGAAAGATIGLALGGPAGAVVGAAAGPLATLAVRVLGSLVDRFCTVLEEKLAGRGVATESFLAEVERDPKKRAAYARLLQLSTQVTEERQVDVLAAAAAALHNADARHVAALHETAGILAALTTLQVDILAYIAAFKPDQDSAKGVTPDRLLAHFYVEAPLVRHAARSLELHGLVVDEARLDHARGVFWRSTEFGEWILALLQSDAASVEGAPTQ